VNVDRFLRFTAEKKEPVSLMSKNLWHTTMVSSCGDEGSAYFMRTTRITHASRERAWIALKTYETKN
jgi:hypothetical protein